MHEPPTLLLRRGAAVWRRFRDDRSGNLMLLFGLMAVPMLGITGGAVEYGVLTKKKEQVQSALDSALLNAARKPWTDQTALKTSVQTQMTAQLTSSTVTGEEWSLGAVEDRNGRITGSADVKIKTSFLSLLQIPQMSATVDSAVNRDKNIEVVLVLDNTGSMGNGTGRIEALRTAAKKLVDKVSEKASPNNTVKVALVPFVTGVNIRVPGKFDWSWIDGAPTNGAQKFRDWTTFYAPVADHHGVNFELNNGARRNHLRLFKDLKLEWKGCVEARSGGYDVTTDAPDATKPNTLFVPWFWPDEPDDNLAYAINNYDHTEPRNESDHYLNDYLKDGFTKNEKKSENGAAERQLYVGKYESAGADPEGWWRKGPDESASEQIAGTKPTQTYGPNKTCPEPLTPLTADLSTMKTQIDAMRPWDHSGTNVAQGMVWGWNVLSPETPFTEGAPWTDHSTQKAMIVLTDGENMIYGGLKTHNRSDYNAYGYLAQRKPAQSQTVAGRLGTTDQGDAIEEVNKKVRTLCTSIKDKNIRLYVITFQLNSTSAQTMYRNCATQGLYYNSPSTAELDAVFTAIATDLGRLRISQ